MAVRLSGSAHRGSFFRALFGIWPSSDTAVEAAASCLSGVPADFPADSQADFPAADELAGELADFPAADELAGEPADAPACPLLQAASRSRHRRTDKANRKNGFFIGFSGGPGKGKVYQGKEILRKKYIKEKYIPFILAFVMPDVNLKNQKETRKETWQEARQIEFYHYRGNANGNTDGNSTGMRLDFFVAFPSF